MEFRLLGEMELLAAGQLLDLGTPRQQAVLAALLVDAGRPVGVETLIDRIWGEDHPAEARNVLYSHLSRIRQSLKHAASLTGEPAARIERRYAGYTLDVDPNLVDLHRFVRLVENGRDPRRSDAERAGALAEALDLWRGTPLAGIESEWVAQVRSSWRRLRLDAVMEWAQLQLRLGYPAALIATLPNLIAEHPLVEPLEDLLMRALHAAGRDAEALDRYTAVRQRLADELGADPSSELRTLHQAILRGDLPGHPQPDQPAVPLRTVATPAQLPPDLFGFAGRDNELRQLDELLTVVGDQPTAVVVSAVSGTAGIGKTALVVHWAHRVRDRFVDGQLYVNLRGFDPTGEPVTPAEAVRGFLEAFDVPPQRIPAGLEAQIGLYRSLLANRQVLVVLDNARDSDQVRPLLPGVPGCLVIVTSRNQLAGLVATAGAQPLTLNLLTTAEARDLLARRLSQNRIATEPQATDNIISSCARLPLALAIVASRAATHPGFPLATLAKELRRSRGSLDELASTDLATDVRAVFSWSYRQLSPEAARLFRLLGLHPGPDISAPATASLAAIPRQDVRPVLTELTHSHLLSEPQPGRYTFHDLLRTYARELADAHDTEAARLEATSRMLDHYIHTSLAGERLLCPGRTPIASGPAGAGVTPEPLADRGQAMAWFAAERRILLAAFDMAVDSGDTSCIWRLGWGIMTFLMWQDNWHEQTAIARAVLTAAQRLGDLEAQRRGHRYLACVLTKTGRYADARFHAQQCLELSRQLNHHLGESGAYCAFYEVALAEGNHAEALDYAWRFKEFHNDCGNQEAVVDAYYLFGNCYARMGNYQEALAWYEQIPEICRRIGMHDSEAVVWYEIGLAHSQLGDHQAALDCYRRALDLHRQLNHSYYEARTLAHLGDAQYATGDPAAAHHTWRHAVDILERLNHADAERIRTRLQDPENRPIQALHAIRSTDPKTPD